MLGATAWMLVVSVSLHAWSPAEAKPTPCAGRFVVQGRPLLPGAGPSEVNVLQLGGTPYTVDLGTGCGPTEPQLRATRKSTVAKATWTGCPGLTGRVRFAGTTAGLCGKL